MQFDRLRKSQGCEEGLRNGPPRRNAGVDRGELAVRIHPGRLGAGAGVRDGAVRAVARDGAGDEQDRAVVAARCHALHLPDAAGIASAGRWRHSAHGASAHAPQARPAGRCEKFAWLEAMRLLKMPVLLVLFVITFFDAGVHQCYFLWTNDFLKSVGRSPPTGSWRP